MNFYDILLSGTFDDVALRDAVSKALDAPLRDVHVVQSLDEAGGRVPVLVQRSAAKGDVALLVSLYVKEGAAVPEVEVARRLSSILGVQALISDSSDNPYVMILVNADSEPQMVSLDVESLDTRGEYRVSEGDRPGSRGT